MFWKLAGRGSGSFWGAFGVSLEGLLEVSLAPVSKKMLDSAKHPCKTHGKHDKIKGTRI